MINTVACCVLSLPCAFGLWSLAERTVIVPACTAYASAHAMTYTDFKLIGGMREPQSTVVCMLTDTDRSSHDIELGKLVPFLTNLWVEFAMSLEITVPGFAVLLGLARVAWYRRTLRLGA